MNLLPLLATALMTQGSPLEKKITISIPPSRMEVLLPQLAAQAGTQFWVTPATAQEVAMVSVNDVTLDEVMKRLADVCSAEWKQETGGYRLIRTAKLLRDAEATDVALRTGLISNALAATIEEVSKFPTYDQRLARQMADKYLDRIKSSQVGGQDQSFDKMMAMAPAQRAMPSIIAAIGANELGSLSGGKRVVFSTHPTRMQRQLSSKAYPVLKELVRQQALFADEYKKVKPNDGSSYYFASANPDISGNPELGPGEAIVIVQGFASNLTANLIINDPRGEKLLSANYNLTFQPQNATFKGERELELPALSSELAKTLSEASNAGTRGRMMMTSMGDGGAPISFESTTPLPPGAKLPANLKTIVLQPEKVDPLAWTAGATLDLLFKGRNVVAAIPDTAFGTLLTPLRNGSATEGLLKSALHNGGLEITEKDAWVLGRPRYPWLAIDQRVNRAALGNLARRLDSQGYLRLFDLCDFAIAQKKRATPLDMDGKYLLALNPGVAKPAVDALSMPATLRVYGTMSPAQRANLTAGGKINVGMLTSLQREWLNEELFNWWFGSLVFKGAVRGKYGGESIALERTKLMPNGLPPEAPLSVEIAEEQALYAYNGSGEEASIVTAAQLANQRYQNERPDLNAGTATTFERYRAAKVARYTFMVDLPNEIKYGHVVDDLWVDKGGVTWTYDSLPNDIRQAADNQLERLRNTFGRNGAGKNRAIPPQP